MTQIMTIRYNAYCLLLQFKNLFQIRFTRSTPHYDTIIYIGQDQNTLKYWHQNAKTGAWMVENCRMYWYALYKKLNPSLLQHEIATTDIYSQNSSPFRLPLVKLQYIFQRAIFGAAMGRDDGHYCDMLSFGVNVFLVKGSSFLFHPLVICLSHLRFRKQISCIIPI